MKKRKHSTSKVVENYVTPYIKIIRDVLPTSGTLLDVGCGNGWFTYYLQKYYTVTGIDINKEYYNDNPIKEKYIMNCENIIFNKKFDIVFCANVLHHTDYKKTIKEMVKVSKKYVVIIEQNRTNFLIWLLNKLKSGEKPLDLFDIINECLDNNLQLSYANCYGYITANRMNTLMQSILNRWSKFSQWGVNNILILEKIPHNFSPNRHA